MVACLLLLKDANMWRTESSYRYSERTGVDVMLGSTVCASAYSADMIITFLGCGKFSVAQ